MIYSLSWTLFVSEIFEISRGRLFKNLHDDFWIKRPPKICLFQILFFLLNGLFSLIIVKTPLVATRSIFDWRRVNSFRRVLLGEPSQFYARKNKMSAGPGTVKDISKAAVYGTAEYGWGKRKNVVKTVLLPPHPPSGRTFLWNIMLA